MSEAAPRIIVANEPENPVPVTVVDIDMPFFSMVSFIIKWSLAAIPAMIGLAIFWGIVGGIFLMVFGGLLAGIIGASGR